VLAAKPDASPKEVMDTLELGRRPGAGRAARGHYTALEPVSAMLAARGDEDFPVAFEIAEPLAGDVFSLAADTIPFRAEATYLYVNDAGAIEEADTGWTRWVLEGPLDGSFAPTREIAVGPMLGGLDVSEAGRYELRAELTTPDGRTATDSVVFRVQNSPPVIEIVEPELQGDDLVLWYPGPNVVQVRAWDEEDGSLTHQVAWEVTGGRIVRQTMFAGRLVLQMDEPFGSLSLSVTDSSNETTTLDLNVSPWGTAEGMPPQFEIAEPIEGIGFGREASVWIYGTVGAVGLEGDDPYLWMWELITPYGYYQLQSGSRPSSPQRVELAALFGPDAPEFRNGVVPATFVFGVKVEGQWYSKSVDVSLLEEGTHLATCGRLTCAEDAECTPLCVATGVCDKAEGAALGCCRCAVP